MTLPPVKISYPHVEVDASVLAGSPFVTGTLVSVRDWHRKGVPVRRLWDWHRKGTTVDTLLKRYPQLGAAKVLSALAFAYDNRDLIDADLEREKRLHGA